MLELIHLYVAGFAAESKPAGLVEGRGSCRDTTLEW